VELDGLVMEVPIDMGDPGYLEAVEKVKNKARIILVLFKRYFWPFLARFGLY
jgi:hypothetical protein